MPKPLTVEVASTIRLVICEWCLLVKQRQAYYNEFGLSELFIWPKIPPLPCPDCGGAGKQLFLDGVLQPTGTIILKSLYPDGSITCMLYEPHEPLPPEWADLRR